MKTITGGTQVVYTVGIVLALFSSNLFAFTGLICIDQEANPSCSNFGPNDVIEEGKITSVATGSNLIDLSSDGCQKVDVIVNASGDTISSWESISTCQGVDPVPVNVLISKTRNPSADRVCFYEDALQETTAVPAPGSLSQISICYNSPSTLTPEPPPAEDIAACDVLNSNGELDDTGIQCNPDSTVERVLISVDPNADDGNLTLCTCNVDFDPCDAEGGCVNPLEPLKAVPSTVLFGNDGTWVCTVSGGRRTCYNR